MIEAIVVFFVVIIMLQLPVVKGYLGELSVRLCLKFLNKNKYLVINNIMIPAGDDKTAQIDHVVVSTYGIFVIETKNYKGWIFGSENSHNWTQVIFKTKNHFYNPILQNKGHVKALKMLLADYPDIVYIPIVVFTMKAVFKKLDVSSLVVRSLSLFWIIKKVKQEVMSAKEMMDISNTILSANNVDRRAKKAHVARIKENKSIREISDAKCCPVCGGEIVKRQGKYGEFSGCSNYPGCRYIFKDAKR